MGKIKHGLGNHPLANVWRNMKLRCYSQKDPSFKEYGGRGVTVCEEWKNDFLSFYNWAIANGWAVGLQLDKDKLSPFQRGIIYSPESCCFITSKENHWFMVNSKVLEYNNEKKSLGEWATILGLSWGVIRSRIDYLGWDIKTAFETPLTEKRNPVKYNNQEKTLTAWCRELNLKFTTIKKRIDKGWSTESAFTTPINILKSHRT